MYFENFVSLLNTIDIISLVSIKKNESRNVMK